LAYLTVRFCCESFADQACPFEERYLRTFASEAASKDIAVAGGKEIASAVNDASARRENALAQAQKR
jgi:hypothetical protein